MGQLISTCYVLVREGKGIERTIYLSPPDESETIWNEQYLKFHNIFAARKFIEKHSDELCLDKERIKIVKAG